MYIEQFVASFDHIIIIDVFGLAARNPAAYPGVYFRLFQRGTYGLGGPIFLKQVSFSSILCLNKSFSRGLMSI